MSLFRIVSGKYIGLSDTEVQQQRSVHGSNHVETKVGSRWLELLKGIAFEPLFLILLVTAGLYVLLGEHEEALVMFIAIVFVASISLFQENRSTNAQKALKNILEPKARVFRNGSLIELSNDQLVVADLVLVEDGDVLPADGLIIESHDFSVNESILTGESLAIFKSKENGDQRLFQGTLVSSGYCVLELTAVGENTELGKIGKTVQQQKGEKTPIQIQINQFVKSMVQFGLLAFLLIWAIQYYITQNIVYGLLKGLTLSMSILPEEIPVAFSTFMALGALHLYRKKVLVKKPMTVETLGAVSVICLDKTGTITENRMQLYGLYDYKEDRFIENFGQQAHFNETLEYAMWASEESPFDPMEQSIHACYSQCCPTDQRSEFKMYKEYPLSGKPPIMTHVFRNDKGSQIIAVKGGVEGILAQCELSQAQLEKIIKITEQLASKGHRILGVGRGLKSIEGLPDEQGEFKFEFLGLVSFYDPPRGDIQETLQSFYKAGVDVKILSGDYPQTTYAIAKQIGIRNAESMISGDQIAGMNQRELCAAVQQYSLFTRMHPDAKTRVIEALKQNGEIVAMTGDGVNDGPALKAAHIGIAMGQRASELARKSASLILADDHIAHMVDGIALGRRIYENLKKAIQYIISIHIPIILIVTLPLLLFWRFSDIFNPVHVIFLELIMGPTCSIIYENEPIESTSMSRPPRKTQTTLFTWKELSLSIIQGLVITFTCLSIAQIFISSGATEQKARTALYTCLIFSNLFLTIVNRSFVESAWSTLRYKNILIPLVLCVSLAMLGLSIYQVELRKIFGFESLRYQEVLTCLAFAFVGVIWVELFKWYKRYSLRKPVLN